MPEDALGPLLDRSRELLDAVFAHPRLGPDLAVTDPERWRTLLRTTVAHDRIVALARTGRLEDHPGGRAGAEQALRAVVAAFELLLDQAGFA